VITNEISGDPSGVSFVTISIYGRPGQAWPYKSPLGLVSRAKCDFSDSPIRQRPRKTVRRAIGCIEALRVRRVTSGSRRASDISDSRSCLSRYAVIRDQRASCALISRASSGEPRKSRVSSPKGGGAAGVPRSTPVGLPRLLAGTRWRGERCARYAFISSASSNPSQSVDRSAGLSACLLAVCSNKKVSNGEGGGRR